jgi:hypothetical protein
MTELFGMLFGLFVGSVAGYYFGHEMGKSDELDRRERLDASREQEKRERDERIKASAAWARAQVKHTWEMNLLVGRSQTATEWCVIGESNVYRVVRGGFKSEADSRLYCTREAAMVAAETGAARDHQTEGGADPDKTD